MIIIFDASAAAEIILQRQKAGKFSAEEL